MDKLEDFEPLDYYNGQLRAEFEKNAAEYFDGLVKRSGVDVAANAAAVKKYAADYAEGEFNRALLEESGDKNARSVGGSDIDLEKLDDISKKKSLLGEIVKWSIPALLIFIVIYTLFINLDDTLLGQLKTSFQKGFPKAFSRLLPAVFFSCKTFRRSAQSSQRRHKRVRQNV